MLLLQGLRLGLMTTPAEENISEISSNSIYFIEACDCGKNGKCYFSDEDEQQCKCDTGFLVIQGELKYCKGCDCGKNGKCYFSDEGEQVCECDIGYSVTQKEGNKFCQECDCGKNGKCYFDNEGQKQCDCDLGSLIAVKEGNTYCHECDCGNNGKCYFGDEGEQECECNIGFSVREKEGIKYCQGCDCGKNGKCYFDDRGEKECYCNSGYIVTEKEGNKYCRKICDKECLNGGSCDENGLCKCKPRTSGDDCSIIDDCYKLGCDFADARCVYDKGNEVAMCQCNNKTHLYADGKCRATCYEDKDCNKGRVCTRTEKGKYLCECPPNFKGAMCEINVLCEVLEYTCRTMNAQCVVKGSKAFCICPSGKNLDMKSGLCVDICNLEHCVYGRCEMVDSRFKCR
ncbi:hypothetical protein NPIL_400161 [Nephila pilipes]|uniref:EGF-like domain-containing protein n=1 Tax=Nephila pilipes TaxID=299642 RepID=A0A8X6IIJ2_NEPPI|nr:hypothetical protein NPIL_400161 [Nephila pilipes]